MIDYSNLQYSILKLLNFHRMIYLKHLFLVTIIMDIKYLSL